MTAHLLFFDFFAKFREVFVITLNLSYSSKIIKMMNSKKIGKNREIERFQPFFLQIFGDCNLRFNIEFRDFYCRFLIFLFRDSFSNFFSSRPFFALKNSVIEWRKFEKFWKFWKFWKILKNFFFAKLKFFWPDIILRECIERMQSFIKFGQVVSEKSVPYRQTHRPTFFIIRIHQKLKSDI